MKNKEHQIECCDRCRKEIQCSESHCMGLESFCIACYDELCEMYDSDDSSNDND